MTPTLPAVRAELLSFLRCPETGTPLTGWDGISDTGTLTARDSGRTYPVRDGIPCLLPDDLAAAPRNLAPQPPLRAGEGEPEGTHGKRDALGVLLPLSHSDEGGGGGEGEEAGSDGEVAEKRSEMQARDAQVSDYDNMMGLRLFTSVEVPITLQYLRLEPGHLLLEGGCGTGRMTPYFADRVRGMICVDFSMESLRVAKRKLAPAQAAKTLFVQADLSQLPLRSEVFDRVGSFGVYEHIPTEETRDRAVADMLRVMTAREAGSRFALSAYRWGPPISWNAQKEGHHDGGIYYKRFTQKQLLDLLGARLSIGGATEALLYYHLVWGRKFPGQ